MKNTNVIELAQVKKQKDKQAFVNELGDKLKDLFLNEYGYIDYDPDLIPVEIELDGVKLQLAENGHEDCPQYNSQVMYIGEIEEMDIQIWVEYYSASVFHTLKIMPAFIGEEYYFQDYEYEVPKDFIIATMAQLMYEEL